MKKGFTLLELLIVMAVLAILASILLVVVKPQQIFSKARDTQRKSDARNLMSALETYLIEAGSNINLTSGAASANGNCLGGSGTPTIYYSSTAGVTTPVPTGFSAVKLASATSSTMSNGSGWVPVNFTSIATLNLSALPLDPTNSNNNVSPSLYYTYACRTDNTYEIDANLESMTTDETTDGGNNNSVYEAGTDKTILPAATSTAFYPG
jgi:prepilin-type N-terminal cleavage/methylation domain-containing protein